MITEKGSIKAGSVMNAQMQQELNRGANKLSLALIIIGAIGVGIFLILEIFLIFIEKDEIWEFVILIIFAAILGMGISIKSMINRAMKTVTSASVKVNEYEFFKGYFILNEYNNGENVGTAKIYNNQIIKSKESGNYLFFYINPSAVYPVEKRGLTEAELNTLRAIFKLPVKGSTVALSETVSEEKSATPPDPYEEFNSEG